MARIPGRLSKALVSNDGAATFVMVGGIESISLNASQAEIKTTSHDDGPFEAYIPGRIDATIDLKLRWDEADPGQTICSNGFFNGSTYDWKFYMQVGTGYRQVTGKGIITKHTSSGGNDDAAGLDLTVRLTGTLVAAAQA